MKNTLFLLFTLFVCSSAKSQSTAGLIAHWDMNGTPNDVSGNGHNGHQNNVSAAMGMDNVIGHGYYFNGTNSWITVPYSPAFNVSNYSICATIKVLGFYSGTCHNNMIFARGNTGLGNCVYVLGFYDLGGSSCTTAVDSTTEAFWTGSSAPSATLSPASMSSFSYTPYITKYKWYKVVVTFNDTTYKLYVDDTLRNTVNITNPGLPMGTGTDSISIGYSIFQEATRGYPYPFKGIIDDIMLYNRVLSDSEAVHYGDSCGRITLQPVRANFVAGGSATYTVRTTTSSATYQWQTDAGTGFVNLSNAGPYSGVTTNTLRIAGATVTMANYRYRCLISNPWGCADTSTAALLTTAIADLKDEGEIIVFPNPASKECSILSPLPEGKIQIFDQIGQLVKEETVTAKRTEINISTLIPGLYVIKIECNGRVQYQRLLKS